MKFTHKLIDDVVLVQCDNGTTVKVRLHDNGELDFDGNDDMMDEDFEALIEYVVQEFPGPEDE